MGATTIPAESVPSTGVGDKFEHFLGYFILAILLSLTLFFQNKFPLLKQHYLISTVLICLCYGIIDELHQLIVPGRSCELLDWLSDVGGAIIGIIFVRYLLINLFIKNSEVSDIH